MYASMNREVSSKNSKRLLKNLQNMTGGNFFATPCFQIACCTGLMSGIYSKQWNYLAKV